MRDARQGDVGGRAAVGAAGGRQDARRRRRRLPGARSRFWAGGGDHGPASACLPSSERAERGPAAAPMFALCSHFLNIRTSVKKISDFRDCVASEKQNKWRMTVDWIRAGLKRPAKPAAASPRRSAARPRPSPTSSTAAAACAPTRSRSSPTYLGVEPPRLVGGGRPPPPSGKVPLVGYVGAGAVAHFYADGQGPFDEVDARPTRRARRPSRCRSAAIRSARCSTIGWSSTTTCAIRRRRSRRAHVRLRPRRRARADQGAEAQPDTRPVDLAVEHRAADLRRRARLWAAPVREMRPR